MSNRAPSGRHVETEYEVWFVPKQSENNECFVRFLDTKSMAFQIRDTLASNLPKDSPHRYAVVKVVTTRVEVEED